MIHKRNDKFIGDKFYLRRSVKNTNPSKHNISLKCCNINVVLILNININKRNCNKILKQ